jgi:hypothetical protein
MNSETSAENKMEKHLTVVAALQVGFSVLGILAAIIVYTVLHNVMHFADDPETVNILRIVARWVSLFLLVISIPGLVGGIGLFMKKNWARILVLIISVLDLLNIPLGTIIAVYSIWVLVQEDTVKLFDDQESSSDK